MPTALVILGWIAGLVTLVLTGHDNAAFVLTMAGVFVIFIWGMTV